MDRLSSYAARESDAESPEDRKQSEEEATNTLMEKLRISKEKNKSEAKGDETNGAKTNGREETNSKSSVEESEEAASQVDKEQNNDVEPHDTVENGDKVPSRRDKGIPQHVKLFEIFYDQVTNLVHAQRLQIQDIIALLVSLSNLAL